MKNIISNRILPVLLSFVLISCPRQKQVWLSELWQTHMADQSGFTRLYIDKYGELYPPFYITYKDFFDPDHTDNTTRYKDSMHGSLRYLFTSDTARLHLLTATIPISVSSNDPNQQFDAVQEKMITDYASRINGLSGSTGKEVIIFIHGFNDPNPTGSYMELRDAIKNIKPNLTYVEIYWDGLTANNGNPGTEHIWGWAQSNSAYVSLTIRKLLNKLSADSKIRIISHSLGASVVTGALFNTTSKWKKSNWDYFKLVLTIPAPSQADIRIGMVAPAVPGTSTFEDFNARNPDIQPSQNNISRIVIGYNKNDYALTKTLFSKTQKLAPAFGATTLGCNYRDSEIAFVKELLIQKKYSPSTVDHLIRAVNFSTKDKGKLEEHGLHYYILNPKMTQFLQELFN